LFDGHDRILHVLPVTLSEPNVPKATQECQQTKVIVLTSRDWFSIDGGQGTNDKFDKLPRAIRASPPEYSKKSVRKKSHHLSYLNNFSKLA
jgi:hypothetical protein